MSEYNSAYTGAQIDEAVGKALVSASVDEVNAAIEAAFDGIAMAEEASF